MEDLYRGGGVTSFQLLAGQLVGNSPDSPIVLRIFSKDHLQVNGIQQIRYVAVITRSFSYWRHFDDPS